MNNLKELLLLYSQKLNSQKLLTKEIVGIINQVTRLNLVEANLEAKNGTLKLQVKPKEKLEILLHKELILEEFKKEKIIITDLR